MSTSGRRNKLFPEWSVMASEVMDPLLTTQQLADYLQKPVSTLYQWRYRSEGPRGIKVGGNVRYRLSDVQAWLERQTDGAVPRGTRP